MNVGGTPTVLPLSSLMVAFYAAIWLPRHLLDVRVLVPIYERMIILMKIAQSKKYAFFCCTTRVSFMIFKSLLYVYYVEYLDRYVLRPIWSMTRAGGRGLEDRRNVR